MQYPIFLSPAQVAHLLGIGKTSVYLKIKTGDLIVAKIGRSTKVTLPSVIRYLEKCLQKTNDLSLTRRAPEEFDDAHWQALIDSVLAVLCNTHSKPDEYREYIDCCPESLQRNSDLVQSLEKNSGEEM